MTGVLPDIKNESDFFRKKLFLSAIIPGLFVSVMWLTAIAGYLFEADLTVLGIYPLALKGVPGIIMSPFIHDGFRHLTNNTLPLFFLAVALFYLYSEVALRVFTITWISSGLLVWIAGREAWHIGASGLVYGLASFLFFSGIIRKYFRLVALSLLIVFLYGSMVWGIFPGTYRNVSWEAHMLGFLSGLFLSVWYRDEGPQAPAVHWPDDEEDGESGDGETPPSPSFGGRGGRVGEGEKRRWGERHDGHDDTQR